MNILQLDYDWSRIKVLSYNKWSLKENLVMEAEIILTLAMMIDICIRIIAERDVHYL